MSLKSLKTRKRLWIAIGLAFIGVLLCVYKQRETYRCEICFSTKSVFQWRIGSWTGLSFPLTPSWSVVQETRFQHDFLPQHHSHQWLFAQGSPYYCLGFRWSGCAIGPGRRESDLCQVYDSSEEFRQFIRAKLQGGTLAKSNFVNQATNGGLDRIPMATSKMSPLLDEFFNQ